ncbi:MAG: histidine--tRNA ligase [Nitrososphaerota archaeon]|nr:histidine--tRNA ligase [Nitrososphaerota archaeon]MDG7025862.1 histidine--tRNA ligase [Nitrososphaerota archaeon]
MDLALPRGVDDVGPDRYALHSKVRSAFEEVARLYNFQLMEPASLEHLGVLRAKSGEAVDKEIYAFKDKGGRDIGLRFDMTVGMTRYVCSRKGLRLPVKLAASGGIWRYDEPQYGRYRWSHQWDLEVFGPPSVEIDAEVLDACSAMLSRLGLSEATIKIGDRRVVEGFIRGKVGITDETQLVDLMRALDKVEKKTADELTGEYVGKGFDPEQVRELLGFGSIRGRPDDVLSKVSELGQDATKDLRVLADMLDSRGVRNVEYNMSIVRGIDYYTGIVFEAADNRNPRLGSLFGGGRYDALPRMFGRLDLSASGAAGGVERMALSIAAQTKTAGLLVYVAVAGGGFGAYAAKVRRALMDAGIPCEASLQDRQLSKQLEDASRIGATWAVIVGDREAKARSVTLRDMKRSTEETMPLEDAVKLASRA